MTEATVRSYDELQKVFRARADECNISREQIDELAGLPRGYAAKVLADEPMRRLGPVTMGPMLQALGLKLLVVVDPEAEARFTARVAERDSAQVRASGHRQHKPAIWLFTSRKARRIRKKQAAEQSPAARKRIARKAAKARWKKRRLRIRKSPPCLTMPMVE